MKAKKMYKNKNKNTRDKATQPAQATNAVSSPPCTNYEELDELQLERCYAGNQKQEITEVWQEIFTLTQPEPEECETKRKREEALNEAYSNLWSLLLNRPTGTDSPGGGT